MCFYYEFYPDFSRTKVVKAKKEHKCSECSGIINSNESYEYAVFGFEGLIDCFKVCDKCIKLRQKIHDIEILRGCSEHESWPPYGELKDCMLEGNYG